MIELSGVMAGEKRSRDNGPRRGTDARAEKRQLGGSMHGRCLCKAGRCPRQHEVRFRTRPYARRPSTDNLAT